MDDKIKALTCEARKALRIIEEEKNSNKAILNKKLNNNNLRTLVTSITFSVVIFSSVVINSKINTNSTTQKSFSFSKIEIESYIKTTVKECFSFYKVEIKSKKYIIKNVHQLKKVASKAKKNAMSMYNKEILKLNSQKFVETKPKYVRNLILFFKIQQKTKLKEKVNSYYVSIKSQFLKEVELSNQKQDFYKQIFKVKTDEVVNNYRKQITEFLMRNPCMEELRFFHNKLKIRILESLNNVNLVLQKTSRFSYKLLEPNETHIRNKNVNYLSIRLDQIFLKLYNFESFFLRNKFNDVKTVHIYF